MRYGMKINIPILLHVGTFIDDSSTSNHHHQGDLPAFTKCQLQLDLDLDLQTDIYHVYMDGHTYLVSHY